MIRLRQRDGTTCGPAVAVVAGTILDPDYGARLTSGTWFADEQERVHTTVNRVWPRFFGTTPAGIARAFSEFLPYRWRLFRGRRDDLVDVIIAVGAGVPVAMLLGNVIPRHWVLLVEVIYDEFRCYEPSSGEMRSCSFGAIRRASLAGLGYRRPFAFVVPRVRPQLPQGDGEEAQDAPRIAALSRLLGGTGYPSSL